jgi:hypothetical protein
MVGRPEERRPRRDHRRKAARRRRASPAEPPTTPPMMAPLWEGFDEDGNGDVVCERLMREVVEEVEMMVEEKVEEPDVIIVVLDWVTIMTVGVWLVDGVDEEVEVEDEADVLEEDFVEEVAVVEVVVVEDFVIGVLVVVLEDDMTTVGVERLEEETGRALGVDETDVDVRLRVGEDVTGARLDVVLEGVGLIS